MKRIDRLLLSSFFGPFLVSFGIALFVLVMQILWLYIDEIAGKGVGVLIMMELVAYMSISLFPMAFPIGMLIASVMVMGNLAERYELSSMKSAGLSLLRIMRSLIFAAAAVAVFSYVCSDFLIPVATLKFKSRLYDIRKQKPALTLEKGIFNEDFRQFIIRIGDKKRDGETIGDVMIIDQTQGSNLRLNEILADSGQMYTTADKRFFVMNLFNGTQYQEPNPQDHQRRQKYPFVRISFDSWTKVWDLREFDLNRTKEDRFKGQRSMLSMRQLRANIDSLRADVRTKQLQVADELLLANRLKPPVPETNIQKLKPSSVPGATPPQRRTSLNLGFRQELAQPLEAYGSLFETFHVGDRPQLKLEATSKVKSFRTNYESRKAAILNRSKDAVKTAYELYIKYTFALVCFVFLFIGAPMGAIIRKGGFGYPILVAIIFFVVFIMLTIACRKLAEQYVLSPFWAAMMPCVSLMPIGAFLTFRAMNDSRLLSTDRLEWLLYRLRRLAAAKPPATA